MSTFPPEPLPPIITNWFTTRNWSPRQHQLDVLASYQSGASQLLIAPTGAGKTLAGFLPTLADLATEKFAGLHTLYISPLKALAVDVQRNLSTPIAEMRLPISVEARTGDTPASKRARQRTKPPHILLATPEQLALLISHPQAELMFGSQDRPASARLAITSVTEAAGLSTFWILVEVSISKPASSLMIARVMR